MMDTESLRLSAYAKVNLSLEVLGKRVDGYHEVATVMQTVDLTDSLWFSQSDDLEVECDVPGLSGAQNIVWDAAIALARHAGFEPMGRIEIQKRIPLAAGLGGGSADAAAALRGLNGLWRLGLRVEELGTVAATLGSDVPFLLNGGTALGTGRGEVLRPLEAPAGAPVLLVVPAESIPRKTPTMYGALRGEDLTNGNHTRRLIDGGAIPGGTLTSGLCRNAFTRAALGIFPGLRDVWETVSAIAKYPPGLSGAGPAFFCKPSDEGEREQVAYALRNTGATVRLVRTINPTHPV